MAILTPEAVFPTNDTPATGQPDGTENYSGTFIPSIWSGKLIEKFYDATVLAAISNTDYEGEIKNFGDKVVIRQKPDILIKEYTAGLGLTSDRPTAPVLELLIDTGKYWSTELDDVMEIQTDVDMMSMWADDASEQMKIVVDTDVLLGNMDECADLNRGPNSGLLSGNLDLGETLAPVVVTKNDVTDLILRASQCLDEQNIPESGRWIVIPAWMAAKIKGSELKDASLTGDGSSILRNGRLGMIDRFTIYMSNLLPNATNTAAEASTPYNLAADEFICYFGHSCSLTFASQVTKTETLRAESTFGTIMRGLQVYGHKVVKPEALGELVVTAG